MDSLLSLRAHPSAIWLRQEFPVQRKRIFVFWGFHWDGLRYDPDGLRWLHGEDADTRRIVIHVVPAKQVGQSPMKVRFRLTEQNSKCLLKQQAMSSPSPGSSSPIGSPLWRRRSGRFRCR